MCLENTVMINSDYIRQFLNLCINTKESKEFKQDINLLEFASLSNEYLLSSWLFPSFLDMWISKHNKKNGRYSLIYVERYSIGKFVDEPLEPPGGLSLTFKKCKMPYDDEDICQNGMDRGAMHAGVHRAPIWQVQTKETNCFF